MLRVPHASSGSAERKIINDVQILSVRPEPCRRTPRRFFSTDLLVAGEAALWQQTAHDEQRHGGQKFHVLFARALDGGFGDLVKQG